MYGLGTLLLCSSYIHIVTVFKNNNNGTEYIIKESEERKKIYSERPKVLIIEIFCINQKKRGNVYRVSLMILSTIRHLTQGKKKNVAHVFYISKSKRGVD